jgi:hypothetical protein
MISAEIPPEGHPLRNSVCEKMLHGPCGVYNPSSPCMRNGKCSKNYPKPLRNDTIIGEDAFAQYRRRSVEEGGHTFNKRLRNGTIFKMDNSWVVPHMPYLIAKFDAHINTEYCATIKSIKYLFKYEFKGNDQATVTFDHDHAEEENPINRNEIEIFQNKRYVSSVEACWRLFKFEVCAFKPSIVRLPIHLPEQQRVLYDPNDIDSARRALQNAKKNKINRIFCCESNVSRSPFDSVS